MHTQLFFLDRLVDKRIGFDMLYLLENVNLRNLILERKGRIDNKPL